MSGPPPADAWQVPAAAAMEAASQQVAAITRAAQRQEGPRQDLLALLDARDQLETALQPLAGAALQPGLRCLPLPALPPMVGLPR